MTSAEAKIVTGIAKILVFASFSLKTLVYLSKSSWHSLVSTKNQQPTGNYDHFSTVLFGRKWRCPNNNAV